MHGVEYNYVKNDLSIFYSMFLSANVHVLTYTHSQLGGPYIDSIVHVRCIFVIVSYGKVKDIPRFCVMSFIYIIISKYQNKRHITFCSNMTIKKIFFYGFS